jgi:hypothetical protein
MPRKIIWKETGKRMEKITNSIKNVDGQNENTPKLFVVSFMNIHK